MSIQSLCISDFHFIKCTSKRYYSNQNPPVTYVWLDYVKLGDNYQLTYEIYWNQWINWSIISPTSSDVSEIVGSTS